VKTSSFEKERRKFAVNNPSLPANFPLQEMGPKLAGSLLPDVNIYTSDGKGGNPDNTQQAYYVINFENPMPGRIPMKIHNQVLHKQFTL